MVISVGGGRAHPLMQVVLTLCQRSARGRTGVCSIVSYVASIVKCFVRATIGAKSLHISHLDLVYKLPFIFWPKIDVLIKYIGPFLRRLEDNNET